MTQDVRSLHVLLEQAERERDRARQQVQACERQAQQALGQAMQLLDYRVEYRQRWSGEFARGGTIALVQCHHGFAGRLDQAIDQQQQVADRTRSRVEAARAQLLAREQRVAAVRKLIERRLHEHALKAERRDQRQADEAATRAATSAPPIPDARAAI